MTGSTKLFATLALFVGLGSTGCLEVAILASLDDDDESRVEPSPQEPTPQEPAYPLSDDVCVAGAAEGQTLTLEVMEPYADTSNYLFDESLLFDAEAAPCDNDLEPGTRILVAFSAPRIPSNDCYVATLELEPALDSGGTVSEQGYFATDRGTPLGVLHIEGAPAEGAGDTRREFILLSTPTEAPFAPAQERQLPPLLLSYARQDTKGYIAEFCTSSWVVQVAR